jgi:hypothetical protein
MGSGRQSKLDICPVVGVFKKNQNLKKKEIYHLLITRSKIIFKIFELETCKSKAIHTSILEWLNVSS